ncbi:uncharacterized protein LOC123702272 [Colias croceus]|uniref:uncharacterized protein LOC123702272 n=1 Tax=Colias crocea TaxID=72248 RepID=UPI001E27EAC6|nr:uncharacterized protein LOC123702272 [Colias croceus]
MKYCVVLLMLIRIVNEVYGGCTLSLKNDFSTPSPVYLLKNKFLAPNTQSGDILLRRSETLQVACPGRKISIVLGNTTTDFDLLNVKCVSDKLFRSREIDWIGEIKEIKCTGPPWFSEDETNRYCHGRNKIYRTGYNISGTFHTLYEICFDKELYTPVYVKHELTPMSNFKQVGVRRPSFYEGQLFGKVRISRLYKIDNQRKMLRGILGAGMDEKYITKIQFINRGHLAPNADFTLNAEQRASFHYGNAAPQWMRGNAGDWAAVEDAVRRRVNALNTTVTVYTGAYGVATLADENNVQQKIYLGVDGNNNFIVPVPLYFFKVIYDPQERKAVVFVLINSTYYNTSTIDELSFCSDICDDKKFSWLRWRNDGTHSFCCEYEDFVEHIDVLPKLNVQGLFY